MKLRKSKKPVRPAGRQRRQTDWQRPSTFSYHAQRSQRDQAPDRGGATSLADKRQKLLSVQFWARRSGLLIAIFVALVCLVSIISLSNRPRIVLLNNQRSATAFHDSAAYEQAASQALGSSVWNRNKLTVNNAAVEARLKQQFPELASVNITLPLIGHRPVVYVRANPPAFVLQTHNGNFIVDSAGTVLATKDAAMVTTASLPTIVDQTGIQAVVGKQVISSSEAGFIKTVVVDLAAKQIGVTSLVLPADSVQQLNVQVNGQPYIVKFNMHDAMTVRQQVGTYLATAANLAGQHVTPSQYIDVRVAGRAYFQ